MATNTRATAIQTASNHSAISTFYTACRAAGKFFSKTGWEPCDVEYTRQNQAPVTSSADVRLTMSGGPQNAGAVTVLYTQQTPLAHPPFHTGFHPSFGVFTHPSPLTLQIDGVGKDGVPFTVIISM